MCYGILPLTASEIYSRPRASCITEIKFRKTSSVGNGTPGNFCHFCYATHEAAICAASEDVRKTNMPIVELKRAGHRIALLDFLKNGSTGTFL